VRETSPKVSLNTWTTRARAHERGAARLINRTSVRIRLYTRLNVFTPSPVPPTLFSRGTIKPNTFHNISNPTRVVCYTYFYVRRLIRFERRRRRVKCDKPVVFENYRNEIKRVDSRQTYFSENAIAEQHVCRTADDWTTRRGVQRDNNNDRTPARGNLPFASVEFSTNTTKNGSGESLPRRF